MNLAPRASKGRSGPGPDLAELAELLKDDGLAAALRDSVRSWPGRVSSDRKAGQRLGRLILDALDAVGRNLESNPRTALLLQLIRDERELTDEEIGVALELIHSHMVNRFKGDLAEILAVGTCAEYVTALGPGRRLPPNVELVLGGECPRLISAAMAKGPDALLVASGGDHVAAFGGGGVTPASNNLVIYGIVEVKSYLLSVNGAERQFAAHRQRVARGVRLNGRSWSGDRLWFYGASPKGFATAPSSKVGGVELVELLVVPATHRTLRKRSTSSRPVRLHLPFDRERLMSAAYCMTEWFASLLGERVFADIGSPWPEMTPEEAGFNRIKEALYHIQLRDFVGLTEHAPDPVGWRRRARRLDRISARLYNAYGWGLSEALRHKGMMWSIEGPGAGESHIEELPIR